MEYYLISDYLYGSSATDRLSMFLPFVPLCLACTSILLATSMTNPFLMGVRKAAGLVPATKWMTLKWRLFHLALALLFLFYYLVNNSEADEISSNMSFYRFMLEWQSGSTPNGAYIGLILYYIVLPPFAIFVFVKSLTEVLCSKQVIRTESIFSKKFGGQGGLVQTISAIFYLTLELGVCEFVRFGVFESFDAFYVLVFHLASSLPWIFRKTGYDFKQDVEEFNNSI